MNKLISCGIVVIMLLGSCDNEKTEAGPDVQALLTSGIWKMKTVTIDGVNKNDLFTNFTVSFTSTGFTASNGEPVWPASGTWTFTTADQNAIVRNDNIEVSVAEISANELTLKLMWSKTTLGSGRVASTQGNHVFIFGK